MIRHTRKKFAPCKLLLLALALLFSRVTARDQLLRQANNDEIVPETAEYATDLEEMFDYLNSFLAGFRSQETIPSATNCTKYLEGSILTMNQTMQDWEDENLTANMT